MRFLLLTAVLCALSLAAHALAATEANSVSYVSVSADGQTVYFTCWGDIWSAPRDGSAPARRLTDNVAYDGRPLPSPDGKQLAFLSDRFGNYDVFVMPEEGGEARRLTWDSATDYPYDWKPDGSAVLMYCLRDSDLWGYSMWELPLDGSQPERLSGPDHDGHVFCSYLGSADEIVYARDPGNWTRKHYRGSFAYNLWKYDVTNGRHTRLTEFNGKDYWPQPSPDGQTIYFISDRDDTDNIWSCDSAGGSLQQLTHFRGDGPRWPRISSDGDEIACEVFGEFYIVPVGGGKPERVPISFADDPKHEMQFDSDLRDNLDEFNLSPNGNYFAVTILGDIYLLKNPDKYEDDDKPDQDLSRTRQLTSTPQHEQQVTWHPDSTKIAYLSDRDGQNDVYMLDLATLEETRITDTPVDEWYPQFAPHNGLLAYYSDRDKLMLYDLEAKSARVFHEGIMRTFGRDLGYEWSPDAAWIAYGEYVRDDLNDVWIKNLATGEKYNVSDSPNWSTGLTWSPDGKWLAWTEEAYYYEEPEQGTDVMLLELSPKEETYDFDVLFPEDMPEPDEPEEPDAATADAEAAEAEAADADAVADDSAEAEDAEDTEDEEGEEEEVEPVEIDLEDLSDRAERVTDMEGSASAPRFSSDSSYLIFSSDHTGEREVWSMTIDGRSFNQLTGGGKDGWEWSPDGKRLYYISGGRIGYLEMNGAASKGGGSVATTSAVAWDQWQVWDEVLVEGWRYLRDYYYDEDMHGADWDAVLERYRPRVRYVGTADEFGQLYREMLGELNSSHISFSNRDSTAEAPAETTGNLGLYYDADYSGPGWKVSHVVKGGPADQPGSRLSAGDVITAVNGTAIAAGANRAQLLRNLDGRPVQLTVTSVEPDEEGNTERMVPVKPVSDRALRQLQYEEWVEGNRRIVSELSGGKLAYQHIQSMNHESLVKFRHELFTTSMDSDALILDVRFNSGGFTSVAVLDLLARRGAYLRVRRGDGDAYYARQQVFEQPVVLLINAHSFSNAEILAHVLKDAGVATIIGEPTGGNVISTGGVVLMDGSRVSMPGFENARLNGVDMELNGAMPDIFVDIDPNLLGQGRDSQIEAAVEYLLGNMEQGNG